MKWLLWLLIVLGLFHLPFCGYLLVSGYVPLGAVSLALLNILTTATLIPIAIRISR